MQSLVSWIFFMNAHTFVRYKFIPSTCISSHVSPEIQFYSGIAICGKQDWNRQVVHMKDFMYSFCYNNELFQENDLILVVHVVQWDCAVLSENS